MTHLTSTQTVAREQARAADGTFGMQVHSAPEMTLASAPVKAGRERHPENIGTDPRPGSEVLRIQKYVAPGVPTVLSPKGITATRRALRNARGETGRGLREVHLSWDSVPPAADYEPFEVIGPKDGRPLIIHVHSGCPDMTISAGDVTIAGGGNGFGITVLGGARATIISSRTDKFSVTAEPGSRVDFFAEEGVRGYQTIREGAVFKLNGNSANLSLSTDPR